jgi:predicted alpha/beta superfamily hydrolase
MMRLIHTGLALIFSCGLFAQVKQEIFESFKLQERRDVKYYFPEDYTPDRKYPVVVVLDGEYLFEQVVAISRFYSQFQEMPQAIIVGIEQRKDDLRWYDCAYDEVNGLPTEKGKQFYEFIGMEILPYLDTTFSTAAFKVFVGYDITANFGNYFLFKDRSIFNAFISISPLLAPEMQSRVPARLAEMDQQIFYHLITEPGKGDQWNAIQQLAQGLKTVK